MSTSAAINRSAGGDSNPLFENKCQLHPQYIYHVMNFSPDFGKGDKRVGKT